MNNQNKKESIKPLFKHQMIITSVFVIAIILITISGSFAIFTKTGTGNEYNVVQVGKLQLSYVDLNEEGNALTLASGYPTSDEVGQNSTPYRFSVENTGTLAATYTVRITNDMDTIQADGCRDKLIEDTNLRYKFDNQDIKNLNESKDTEGEGYTVYTSTLQPFESNIHEIRIWIKENSPNSALGKHYHGKVVIEIVQATSNDALNRPTYKEQNLNGTDPVLNDNLVPVTIANNGTVTKANLKQEWYNYSKKQWANAVVLEDTAGTYNPGDVIPESDIESYFVWIPRYKYKIFNDGNYTGETSLNPDAPQTIEIEFESKDTVPSNGTVKNEWLSHPAFQAFDTNGFWVGKFESGYRGATTTAEAEIATADATKLVIKPNIYSWRSITVGNMFKTSYEYLRENESHMMKNTEWGAVAYLSHSQYGVGTEIYINNNNTYLTGCGGDSASAASIETCTNAYGSKVDGIYNQTTTGNISGVFDMSGGANEYVMGYNTNASNVGGNSGITSLYADFFTNNRWDKYYDQYASSAHTDYNQRILGDATGEMGSFTNGSKSSWYDDYARFVNSSYPWFYRGGNYGDISYTGIFYFAIGLGDGYAYSSFRIVVAL